MIDHDATYVPVADEQFRLMMEANAAQPYVHAEYERYRRMADAALLLVTRGDVNLAKALADAFSDSNDSIEYYLRRWTRLYLIDCAGLRCGEWAYDSDTEGRCVKDVDHAGDCEWEIHLP